MCKLADYSGKTGNSAKCEVVWEFEEINSYYHDPDADVINPYHKWYCQNGLFISFIIIDLNAP